MGAMFSCEKTIDRGVDNIMFSRESLTEAESEREETEARTSSNRRRSSQENRERELQARRGLEKHYWRNMP